MTQKSPKISKNNVNSIYDQTCSEYNDEVIDQSRPKIKMMTNDDTKISEITKKMFICLIDNISVWFCSPYRGWSPAIRTDPFNGSSQPVWKLDSLEINPFCWTVWMAATTPPCLKINVLYRTDCVYHVRGAAPI